MNVSTSQRVRLCVWFRQRKTVSRSKKRQKKTWCDAGMDRCVAASQSCFFRPDVAFRAIRLNRDKVTKPGVRPGSVLPFCPSGMAKVNRPAVSFSVDHRFGTDSLIDHSKLGIPKLSSIRGKSTDRNCPCMSSVLGQIEPFIWVDNPQMSFLIHNKSRSLLVLKIIS